MPPANLVHPGGEIRKPLVDIDLAGNGLYVGCRDQFQFICSTVKEDAGYFIPICSWSPLCTGTRKMFLHPVRLDVWPVACSSKRAVACGRYWLELAPVAAAGCCCGWHCFRL